uniref:PlsC domain-containing protein n=1 Tax=Strongyloides stercoralis TaxID=6248 RepID=A0A0K0EHF8_STRER
MGFLSELFLNFLFQYFKFIFICYITRVIIIATNLNLNFLNEVYFYFIDCIHDFLEADCPQTIFDIDSKKSNNIIDGRKYFKLTHVKKIREDTFLNSSILKKDTANYVFDIGNNLFISGFEAIIEDDVITALEHHTDYTKYQFAFNPNNLKGILHKTIAYIIQIYRFTFLMPLRIFFILTSVNSFIIAWIYDKHWKLTNYQRKYMGQFGCNLILASFGAYVNFHDKENKPVSPGFITVNHMSPSDAFPLYIDTDLSNDSIFHITGQKGKGIIKIFQMIVGSILPTYWVNRHNQSERKHFLNKILHIAKNEGLIVIFPEGYCSNGKKLLQFRKSIFVDNVNIYPIAYKQNSKYNDIFWWEDDFPDFFIRQLISLGISYDIYYLPKLIKNSNESEEEFAYRTSEVIASKLGTTALPWSGEHIYKKEIKEKIKNDIQKTILGAFKYKFNL